MDLASYNPIIICSPIWMQKLSSPARTFLKNPALKGKDLYIFASFQGRWGEDKEAELVKNLTGTGIVVKGVYRMVLGKKTEEEIKKEVIAQLEKKPILYTSGSHSLIYRRQRALFLRRPAQQAAFVHGTGRAVFLKQLTKRAAQKDKRGQILPAAHEPPVSRRSMFMITRGSVSAGIGQAYTLPAVFCSLILLLFSWQRIL